MCPSPVLPSLWDHLYLLSATLHCTKSFNWLHLECKKCIKLHKICGAKDCCFNINFPQNKAPDADEKFKDIAYAYEVRTSWCNTNCPILTTRVFRCWATRRREMCTTDLVRRDSRPTMGVEVEVTNSFIFILIITTIILILIIPRVTQWLHVPWGPKADVPAIFWDEQSLRELFQHAWHGIKPTSGCSSLTIVESPFCDILLFC